MPVGHQHFFFGKISMQVFCPFLNQIVCFFDVELYELFISPLLDMSLVNIFSYSVGCLFVLLMVCCANAFKFN